MQRGSDLAAAHGFDAPVLGSRHNKAAGKAVASAILGIVALVFSCAIAASKTSAVGTTLLVGIALFVAFVGAWGAFIYLHAERYFNHFAVISGLVLGTLPLILTVTSHSLDERPAPPDSGTGTAATESTTTVPTTTTVEPASPVTSSTSTGGTSSGAIQHLRWAGMSKPFCVNGPSGGPGSWVWASPCDDTLAMDWQLTSAGQIRGGPGDGCLTLLGRYEVGKAVTTELCDQHDGQRWWSDDERLRNEKGGCLDVDIEGDMHLLIQECNGSSEQIWLRD